MLLFGVKLSDARYDQHDYAACCAPQYVPAHDETTFPIVMVCDVVSNIMHHDSWHILYT